MFEEMQTTKTQFEFRRPTEVRQRLPLAHHCSQSHYNYFAVSANPLSLDVS